MITELQIIDPLRAPVSWWKDVPAIRELKTISFEPGLNILWARNGVGKSTVLQAISNLFCCNQIGRPYVTKVALEEHLYRGIKHSTTEHPDGIVPLHDGQAILTFDPNRTPGLLHGGSVFDYDFIEEGLVNLKKVSSGQSTLRQLHQQMGTYVTGETPWPEIVWKMPKTCYDVLQSRIDFLHALFESKIPLGPKTILMDEPEKCLDLDNADLMWQGIRKWSKTHQIIVASHSVFALGIEEANYIELKGSGEDDSYLELATRAVQKLRANK